MGVLERLIERVEDDLVGHEECGPECWCCQPGRADHAELRKLLAMLMVAKDQASSEALNEAIGKLERLDPLAPAADYIPSLRRLLRCSRRFAGIPRASTTSLARSTPRSAKRSVSFRWRRVTPRAPLCWISLRPIVIVVLPSTRGAIRVVHSSRASTKIC